MNSTPKTAHRPILLAALLLTTLVSATAFAQPGPGGPGGPGGPPPGGPPPAGGGPGAPGPSPETVLKEVLGFSDQQLTALQALNEARHQAAQALQQQIADAQRALAEAANAPSPNPTTVGTAFLAVRNLGKQFETIEANYKTGFDGLLTAAQKQKVADIKALQQALGAGEVLRRLGAI